MESLLNKSPGTILGYPITDHQKIWCCYFVPIVFSCCVYIVHIAADIVLTYEFFLEDNSFFGFLTCTFLCLPSLGCFVFTVTTVELYDAQTGCQLIIWFLKKVIEHAFFPVWAMYGYAERIFWSIEAIRSNNDDDREECLWNASKTRPIELYYFLQAYFQALPQLLIQIHILFQQDDLFRTDRVNLQFLTIIMSFIKAAITTMSYHHYESQKLLGRQYPWSRKHGNYFHNKELNAETEVSSELKEENVLFTVPDSALNETLQMNENQDSDADEKNVYFDSDSEYEALPESDKFMDKKRLYRYDSFTPRIRYFVDSSSNTESENSCDQENDMVMRTSASKLRRNISDVSGSSSPPSYAPPSPDNTSIKITSKISSASKPPNYPAPIREITNDDNNSESSKKTSIGAPSDSNADDLKLPIRKYPQQGRNEDDLVGKIVLFMFWLCFLIARIFSFSVFGRFYATAAVCLGLTHYLLMTGIMLIYAKTKSMNRIVLYSFLGYIYVFCLIEFRIKFQRFYQTFLIYFVLVFTENIILTMIWSLKDWENWWFSYILWTIILSSLISVFSIITYIKILKPTKEILYTFHRNYIFK